MRVLHITYWFPGKGDLTEAPWIKNQVLSLQPHATKNDVLHLHVSPAARFSATRTKEQGYQSVVVRLPIKSWYVTEWVITVLLAFYLLRYRVNKHYDLINFHIAYPLLTRWELLKRWVSVPVVITEHWSAYHFNFNVDQHVKLNRVRNIFRRGIPLLTVSQALRRDIERFSWVRQEPAYLVPNTVNTEIFKPAGTDIKAGVFLMASHWKLPKNPAVVIQAFAALPGRAGYQLRIAGGGPLENEIRSLIQSLGLEDAVTMLGRLEPEAMQAEMAAASVFLHASAYETFSVVCAEALCCGTPVLATGVGGITEFVDASNGQLVSDNSVSSWVDGISSMMGRSYDYQAIADRARDRFSLATVGSQYARALREITGN